MKTFEDRHAPWLRLAALIFLSTSPAGARVSAGAVASAEFSLTETAGLRRFGYPVHVVLPVELATPDPAGPSYGLKRGGRDVPAQFRTVTRTDGPDRVALDFNASPGPFDVETYTIERIAAPARQEAGGAGLRLIDDASSIRISGPGAIEYQISANLDQWIRSVKVPSAQFVGERSPGLFVVVAGQKRTLPEFADRSTPGRPLRITRAGPIAVGLVARHTLDTAGARPVVSTVDLTFPASKSWVETLWTLDDPLETVQAMGVDIHLELDTPPALVDCGARSTIYATVDQGESLIFEAGPGLLAPISGVVPSWVIRRQSPMRNQALAFLGRAAGHEAEGWVHVMDLKRSTAVAIADFGRAGAATVDQFDINGTGRLSFARRFLAEKTGQEVPKNPIKTLRFWTHFVTSPVQKGALTSPQAMLAPLVVDWSAPAVKKSEDGR